jgi:cytoskeletal protein CcmA (bactofilin family)
MKADDTARAIRKHVKSNTYIIKNDTFFEKSVHVSGNLITGTNVSFWGDLIVEGALSLGNRSTVRGNVRAESVFIGNDAEIGGILTTIDDSTLLEGARLREVDSGGSVAIKPDAVIDRIVAEGNVEISGKASIGFISTKGKVIVRKA